MADRLLDDAQVGLLAEGNTLRITGQPGFNNATTLCEAGIHWLQSHKPTVIDIDVSNIESSNSGVLCVLLEWLRFADRQGIQVKHIMLSDHLRELVKIAGLTVIPAFNTAMVDKASA
ncbi:antisigma factor binding [Halomonadaceae bacterium LMG 33818]|uniref:STAS domain-containing protein n=1 Tax=Cernens ardua TaxID=3402176 RepID=UPI003EDC71CF